MLIHFIYEILLLLMFLGSFLSIKKIWERNFYFIFSYLDMLGSLQPKISDIFSSF